MMKNLCAIAILILTVGVQISNSQNLVVNHSFEDTIELRDPNHFIVDSSHVLNWATITPATPDYFHLSSGNLDWSIPQNAVGYQDTCDQLAYSGMFIYHTVASNPNSHYREYLTGVIDTPLMANQCYSISFKYSLGEAVSQVSTSNYGVYFSDSIPINNAVFTNNLNYVPQVEINQWLDNKTDWVRIERFYTAMGGERYFTLGNFYNNNYSFTKIIKSGFNNFGGKSSYIYIDDIHIEPVPTSTLPPVDLGQNVILCEGDSLILDPQLPDSTVYVWDVWGENFSDSIIIVKDSTIYLTLDAYKGCSKVRDSLLVRVPKIQLDLGNDTTLCEGETILIGDPEPNASYIWSENKYTEYLEVDKPGNYWLEKNIYGCHKHDTIEITYNSIDANLGNDTNICEGDTLKIDFDVPGATLQWNDADTTNFYQVATADTIRVNITKGRCEERDTLVVNFTPSIENVNLKDTTFCDFNNEVVLNVESKNLNDNYIWSTGETTPQITINESGLYEVEVYNECFSKFASAEISIEELQEGLNDYNIFSPNNDFVNDLFTIYEGNSDEYQIQIFNRWGKLIWETDNPEEHWNGQGASDGQYYYQLSFRNCTGEIIKKKGTVEVKR